MTGLKSAIEQFLADPTNLAKGREAIACMRRNPVATTRELRLLDNDDHQALRIAIDAFWARGIRF